MCIRCHLSKRGCKVAYIKGVHAHPRGGPGHLHLSPLSALQMRKTLRLYIYDLPLNALDKLEDEPDPDHTANDARCFCALAT